MDKITGLALAAFLATPAMAQSFEKEQAAFRSCWVRAAMPPFAGAGLSLCDTERSAYQQVALRAWKSCREQAQDPVFLGSELALCSRETHAVVESVFLGNWAAFDKAVKGVESFD